MGTKILKSAFNGGEVSPEFYGMLNDAKFQAGAATMRNFIPLPHGPASNRAGTKFVSETRDTTEKARLISFNFGLSQAFAVELGEGYFRFHYDGETLMHPTSTPGRTAWSNAVTYAIGDLVVDAGVTYYCIQAGINHTPASSATWWYAQPSTGEYEIPNDYTEDDIFNVNYTQNADVLTLAIIGRPTIELRRYGDTRWIVEEVDFGAPIAAPGAPTITPTGAGPITYSYVVTAIIDGDGESVASTAGTTTNALYTSGQFNTITWPSVTGADRYNVYKLTGGLYGYIGSSTGTSIIDDNIAPDIGITPPLYETPFTKAGAITAVAITNGGTNYPNTYTGGGFTSIKTVKTDLMPFKDVEGDDLVGPAIALYPTLTVSDPTGSGATFLFDRANSWYDTFRGGWLITKAVFIIVTPGSGYTAPVFQLTDIKPSPPENKVSEFKYTLSPIVQTVELIVEDETGFDAELIPVIAGGIVTGITVKNPGYGYSASPTVTISTSGAGSGFVAGAVTVDDDGDYPGAVSYFDQRKVFAATEKKPQNVWATRTGTEANLAYHIPILDDDRISFRVSSREANFIKHIVPLNDLILMTSSAEWRVSSINSDSITPTSISVKPQSYTGCNNVQPIVVNNNAVFCSAKGGHVRELGYSNDSGGYMTGDLSLRATHLFDGETIVDMCMTKTPFPIIWCVSSNGRLLGLVYVPEQQVYAWFRNDTMNGIFESCCSVDDGDADSLYVIVRRSINGAMTRYVERLEQRDFFALRDSYFVDCGITYDGVSTTSITGLDHLEGETVSILADGAVQPRQVVSGGAITLEVAATVVHVGLPIIADVETLPAALRSQAYGQGMIKNISNVWVRVNESSGIFAGPDELNLIEAKQRTTESYDVPPELLTQEIKIVPSAKWGDSGQLFIRQEDPLPLTIVSVTMEVTLGG